MSDWKSYIMCFFKTTSDFNLININKNQQNASKISEDKIYNLHVKLYSTNIAT